MMDPMYRPMYEPMYENERTEPQVNVRDLIDELEKHPDTLDVRVLLEHTATTAFVGEIYTDRGDPYEGEDPNESYVVIEVG